MFRQFSWLELLVVLLIALLIFGPSKLPQLGKAIARTIREFRKTMAGENDESETADEKDEKR